MSASADARFLDGGPPKGATNTNKCEKKTRPWECQNRLPLTCIRHGEQITVPCGRWKTCSACRLTKSWELKSRFINGMMNVPEGKRAMFVTLTFPRDNAPTEDEAHQALRSLVARLRYRGYLGAYGWVLQRQENGSGNDLSVDGVKPGTLHYHGIFHLPWFDDDLKEWRELVVASGFGIQQRIEKAEPKHAGYIASYIADRLAHLNPVRRAFSFSRDFPRSDFELEKQRRATERALLEEIGVRSCDWEPTMAFEAWMRRFS